MKANHVSLSGDDSFRAAVMKLGVFDTHTHLIGGRLAARDFWEIGEYSWLKEELVAAGYPANSDDLSESERREAYARAFAATRNTSMNRAVRMLFRDLYDLEITDATSIKRADEAVRATSAESDWPRRTVERMGIRRIVVNREDHAPFPELPDRCLWFPRIDDLLIPRFHEINRNGGKREEIIRAGDELGERVREAVAKKAPGVMTTLPALAHPLPSDGESLSQNLAASGNSSDAVLGHFLHRICRAAETGGLFTQFFLGIERGHGGRTAPVNDPGRILKLFGLFEAFRCPFELVLGTEINNLDAVQAARIFPHVRVGGLWWYNFRMSSYGDCMQKRFEALPAAKSAFVVSDARCIEWAYAKILMIKELMAGFFIRRIHEGWVSEEDALSCARAWLHDSAAGFYTQAAPAP